MIAVSWNCQGLGVALTMRSLKDHRPQVLFLMETKAKKKKVEYVNRKLKFNNVFTIDAVGKLGGIALFWNNDVCIRVEKTSFNFIHISCSIVASNENFQCTFLYGMSKF